MRAFQRAAQAVSRESAPKLTVITYNILGDGEKLALSKKHDYCARELRLWASRCPRLVAEISGYGAGVVGLQECSARMFRDLAAGLSYGLPPGKLDQPESQPGHAVPQWSLPTGAVAIPVLSLPTKRYHLPPPTPVPAACLEQVPLTPWSIWSMP